MSISKERILNQGQKDAVEGFLNFLLSDQKEFIISGSAGCGKTYLLGYIIEEALPQYYETCDIVGIDPKYHTMHMTAMTNKAVDALSGSLGTTAMTIHSLLGLVVTENYTKGITELKIKRGAEHVLIKDSVIFIDEYSMIDRELYSYLVKRTPGCKIVYVGDRYQLPPVFEEMTQAHKQETPCFDLLVPVRNANQPALVNLCNQLKQNVDTLQWSNISLVPGVIDWLGPDEISEELSSKFRIPNQENKILAYSNNQVNDLNGFIREIRGFDPEELEEGENLILNTTYGEIPTEAQVRVLWVSKELLEFKFNKYPELTPIQYQAARIAYSDSEEHVSLPKNKKYFQDVLKFLAKKKDWSEYFNLKNSFADVRPADACTVHKSQGSTYGTVYIDLTDLSRCTQPKLAARLLYVAVSRAKNRVVFFGDLAPRFGKLVCTNGTTL